MTQQRRKTELDKRLDEQVAKRKLRMSNEERYRRPSSSQRRERGRQIKADMQARRSQRLLEGHLMTTKRSTPTERRERGRQIKLEQARRQRRAKELRELRAIDIRVERAIRAARETVEKARDPQAYYARKARERVLLRERQEVQARSDAAVAAIRSRRAQRSRTGTSRTPPRRIETRAYGPDGKLM